MIGYSLQFLAAYSQVTPDYTLRSWTSLSHVDYSQIVDYVSVHYQMHYETKCMFVKT